MADKNDGGDKTEQPTTKKLRDARKKGQVPKSRDVSSTAALLAWFLIAALATAYAAAQLTGLIEAALLAARQPFALAAPALGAHALHALVALSAAVLLPVAAVGVLAEYLQAGPVFSLERIKPKLENMNPVEGAKRMFSMDNVVELIKAAAKTAALLLIGWLVVRSLLPALALLPGARRPELVGAALWAVAKPVLVWTIALFALLSFIDAVYQRWSFTKKMRMSRRDIRQEMKDDEGDPYIKAQRRQAHEEWSQRNAAQAARGANALIVNPTHVAIAIDYDRETCPVPTIAAKGEEHVARAMREAAEEAGVPIVRNVPLARDLLARAEVGELIPADLFDVIAEVVLWAREVRDELKREGPPGIDGPAPRRRAAPGEDLTRYPEGSA
ncbi:type III secretion system export apparatus subunit SctU [Piscinibacter sp.]|uniref:type III secretion system export apparatus subunit SctU n=1 Tax=Piscinibacter sp. TaxID=1903157 RepID=UPI002BB42F00|nr:type III secretion system export apparatus subunit SctU [Albitalea sp.]HUG22594.1 type III secretion system export apparatus subunit SctU [Albitalea sp.]